MSVFDNSSVGLEAQYEVARALVAERNAILQEMQELEQRLQNINSALIEIAKTDGFEPHKVGITVIAPSTTYDSKIVSLLKERGLRDAIKTEEKPVASKVRDALKKGILSQEEVKPYEKVRAGYVKKYSPKDDEEGQ